MTDHPEGVTIAEAHYERRRAVAIVSGGLDSTVLAYHLANCEFDLHLVTFDYGQRHAKEIEHAIRTAEALTADHTVIELTDLGVALRESSALTGTVQVPEGHYAEDTMRATVVPNRNMTMLSMAAAIAVAEQAQLLAIGAHAGDHYVYPDCRPVFMDAVAQAIVAGNEGFLHPEFRVGAPFIHETKARIVQLGAELSVPFADTWSCYVGGDRHCGRCGTCVERAEAFALAGVTDPTDYADPDFWRTAVAERQADTDG